MLAISRFLHESNYVKGLCCLCLKAESEVNEHLKLNDDAVLNSNTEISINDMLLFTLGENIQNNLICESICTDCTNTLICCYSFIKKCRVNVDHLNKMYESLQHSFSQTVSVNDKTLAVVLDNRDFTTRTYFLKNETTLSKKKKRISCNKTTCRDKIKTKDMVDNLNSEQFKCKVCSKNYLRKQTLRTHYIKMHAPKVHECNKCKKKFSTETILKQHETENHLSVICSECGKAFTSLPTLRQHELSHKTQIVCPDCGRTYKRQWSFKKHKIMKICGQITRKSNTKAAFFCEICNKKYSRKVALSIHIQLEHGDAKGHICNWCNKKFSAGSLLKAHIVTHTLKEKNFVCKICNGKFVTKTSLGYHIRTHTGERPYQCRLCVCRFLSPSRRSEHVKKYHSKLKTCSICFQERLPEPSVI